MDRVTSTFSKKDPNISRLVVLFFLLRARIFCDAANIFVFAGYGEGSRFMSSASIAVELAKRGHNVTALVSNAYSNRVEDEQYRQISFEIFTHKVPLEVVKERQLRIPKAAYSKKKSWMFDFLAKINTIADEHINDCEAILDDEQLVGRLLDREFDLAFIDQFWPCSMLVAEHVARRHVSIMPAAWMNTIGRLNGNPTISAIVPEVNTGFNQQMTFKQRIKNLSLSFLVSLSYWFANKFTPLMRKHHICPGLYPSELYQRAQLLISNVDFALEFPIATQPHVITVGGLTTRPPNPLPQDLEEYVQSSGDAGIIVFSLGTYVTYMKEELIAVFANAFAKLPQKVLWQFRGTPPAILSKIPNIKTMEWLPQNDLLGHNKTRAFMYQGGNNGLYEALYHAVPVVVIPLIGDQPDVAARVKTRGIGLSLDIMTITSEKIVDTLNAVIHEKHYKETVNRLSAIFHDRPMRPVEKAAFWIEHVIKHGGEYMRSPIHDLTWYQYYLLDVVAFLLLVLVVLIVVIVYSCKFAFRCCKRVLVEMEQMMEKIFQFDEEDTESDWTREETFLNQPQIWSAFSHAVATELCLETGANSLTPVPKLEEYSEAFKPLQMFYNENDLTGTTVTKLKRRQTKIVEEYHTEIGGRGGRGRRRLRESTMMGRLNHLSLPFRRRHLPEIAINLEDITHVPDIVANLTFDQSTSRARKLSSSRTQTSLVHQPCYQNVQTRCMKLIVEDVYARRFDARKLLGCRLCLGKRRPWQGKSSVKMILETYIASRVRCLVQYSTAFPGHAHKVPEEWKREVEIQHCPIAFRYALLKLDRDSVIDDIRKPNAE